MPLINTPTRWGAVSQSLHWLTALLIIVAIVLGLQAEDMPLSPAKLNLFIYHKSIGITVLALVVLRIGWKLLTPQPAPATGLSARNQQLAGVGHWLLYGLMFALPVSGWLLNSAANIPFKWLHLFAVPALPGADKSWQEPAAAAHYLLFITLAVAVIGHAGMALLHHLRHHSNVLSRMWPRLSWPYWLAILLLVVTALYAMVADIRSVPNDALTSAPPVASTPEVTATVQHTSRHWQLSGDQNRLGFVGSYDAVSFEGVFKQFSAQLFFDPEQPQQGFFDVTIDTASVTTFTEDWDASLPEPEWFAVADHPQARFISHHFQPTGQGYSATGILTLKGISKPVVLHFQWQPSEDGKVNFSAQAKLNRTDFGIGSGMWADDPTIGFEVTVKVRLLLAESPAATR